MLKRTLIIDSLQKISNDYHYTHLMTSRTTWVCLYQKAEPFWILMKQEMMG